MSQLALPLQLADHAVFASFLPGGNAALVATLRALADGDEGHGCWLWGANSTGKTHLLQDVCENAGDRSAYVPLSLFSAAGADILDGLASRELVCIDDIDRVVGDDAWEAALFDLCNQVFDAGTGGWRRGGSWWWRRARRPGKVRLCWRISRGGCPAGRFFRYNRWLRKNSLPHCNYARSTAALNCLTSRRFTC